MSYESYWGFDGLQETATLHLDGRWDFESGYTIGSAALNVQWEGLREPFEVYPGVVVPRRQLYEARTSSAMPTPIGASGSRAAWP